MWCVVCGVTTCVCVQEGVRLVHRLNRQTIFPLKKIRRVDNLPGESPASRDFFLQFLWESLSTQEIACFFWLLKSVGVFKLGDHFFGRFFWVNGEFNLGVPLGSLGDQRGWAHLVVLVLLYKMYPLFGRQIALPGSFFFSGYFL